MNEKGPTRASRNAGQDYDVGYGKPPKENQFPKGTSGNLLGRGGGKKKEQATYLSHLPSQRMVLEEGARKVRVKSSEGIEECPTSQVVLRSLATDAMKPGNIMAKREYLYRFDHAERAEFARRRHSFDYWRSYVDAARAQLKRAAAAGQREPCLLPHPDDIKFGFADLTVQFLGPIDESDAEQIDRICRAKDLIYEMALFDPPHVQNGDDIPLGQRWIGFWMVHYAILIIDLPPRLRGISDEVNRGTRERSCWPQRRWRAHLEERFAAEKLPFVLTGHQKELVFRLDDLMEQAGFSGGWFSELNDAV